MGKSTVRLVFGLIFSIAAAGCCAMLMLPERFGRISTFTITMVTIFLGGMVWVNIHSSAPKLVRERKWLLFAAAFMVAIIAVRFGEQLFHVDETQFSASYPYFGLFAMMAITAVFAILERRRRK